MNPCPCGFLGHPAGRCRCTPEQVARYRGKLSGPLLDRIDLHLQVPSLTSEELTGAHQAECSEAVRGRVIAARESQLSRQGKTNAALTSAELDSHARCDDDTTAFLRSALDQLALSARGYHRILRVARTIADLERVAKVGRSHVLQAIQLRRASFPGT